jgi:HEAT repeat protein
MPSVPDETQRQILDLLLKRIPEEEFLSRLGLPKDGVSPFANSVLRSALEEKDPDAVDAGISLMYHFGYDTSFLDALNALAVEPWHKRHEDIVFALGKLKAPSSIPALAQSAQARYAYLEDDEAFALGSKSIFALRNIGTPEAIRIIGDLARSDNEVLRKTAIGRLKDLAKNAATEECRSLAAALALQ